MVRFRIFWDKFYPIKCQNPGILSPRFGISEKSDSAATSGKGQVISNLNDYNRHAEDNVDHVKDTSLQGFYGKPWGASWDSAWKDQPWAEDDGRSPTSNADSWGSSHGTNDFQLGWPRPIICLFLIQPTFHQGSF